MFGRAQHYPGTRRGGSLSSTNDLTMFVAKIFALVLSIFAAPWSYEMIEPLVIELSVRFYGHQYAPYIQGLVWLAMYPVIWAIASASLYTLIATASLYGIGRVVGAAV